VSEQPDIKADAEQSPPQPNDRWCCCNRHVQAQATLTLIIDNRISDFEAMEFIDITVRDAGPAFARQILFTGMPF
jgi:hypothetical protein